MQKDRVTIQFCGFGGQGIILSSVIFGTTAVLHSGMNAVQTQSYGSESRGGECQAELILSRKPIISPLADKLDILVAMSQPALNQYLKRLKPGGILIIDPEYVTQPDRNRYSGHFHACNVSGRSVGEENCCEHVHSGFPSTTYFNWLPAMHCAR